jgi:hypothetical protein
LEATGPARICIFLRAGAGAGPGGEVIDNAEALPAPRRTPKKAPGVNGGQAVSHLRGEN